MAIREETQVFANAIHVELGIVLHQVEVQRHKILRTAKRSTRVTGLAGMYHAHNIPADLRGEFFQTVQIRLAHEWQNFGAKMEEI